MAPGEGGGMGTHPSPAGVMGSPSSGGKAQGDGTWVTAVPPRNCTAHPPFHPHPLTQVLEGLGAASLPRAADLLFDLMGKR